MKKIEDDSEWKEKDSAPMPTKGRKGAHYNNQTTNATQSRFPWTTIVMLVIILLIVGAILFFADAIS